MESNPALVLWTWNDTCNNDVLFLQNEVERLNQKSIANNMRICGLQVDIGVNGKVLLDLIINEVLKVACPATDWRPDNIKSARMIRNENRNSTPITVVTFRHDDDEFLVYKCVKGQFALVMILQRLKEGQTSYFYTGKLMVREPQSDQPGERACRKASRKLQGTTSSQDVAGGNHFVSVDDMDVQ